MKTIIFSGTAALGLLLQWPLLFPADMSDQVQPFTAAPVVATYALDP